MTIYVIERKEGRRWVAIGYLFADYREAKTYVVDLNNMDYDAKYRVSKYRRVK